MKGVKVYTESICSKCKRRDIRDCAEGFTPPVNWSQVTIPIRHKGSGWTNNTSYEFMLCPECTQNLLEYLRGE